MRDDKFNFNNIIDFISKNLACNKYLACVKKTIGPSWI